MGTFDRLRTWREDVELAAEAVRLGGFMLGLRNTVQPGLYMYIHN